ncbi:two-component system response regulator AlgR [Sphingomonas jejuensis]|uniref:Two-component system response regulator AlgR n=1 Tax=Sphingomonas jejuensis TaxID=904715 RepID=A0ABX0XMM8_9SPHN|nr:LytTR family DNA-binding domain-containing protein [Sphingomonas jejuensis]NJC34633.1 two-component system response regulator AlgR [Sphingomonas jejuensis]
MTADDRTAPLRTLIADDEPLAVERLQLLCAREPQIEVVGTAVDGDAALRLVGALSPDLLLLDISMPQRDGIDVARSLAGLERAPAIIFVTAYDNFAVEAFDLAAIDYLLKPVAPDRLARAVQRVVERRAEASGDQAAPAPAASGYAEEFWVPHRSQVIRIGVADIDRIDAERDYMRLHVGDRSFLLHQTISALEARLDPAFFIRVHRSTIVRRDRIVALRHDGTGGWQADLGEGGLARIGRTYVNAVKALTGR